MHSLRLGAALGGLMTPLVVAGLGVSVGLDAAGWVVGLVSGWLATALMVAARSRSTQAAIMPADWFTLVRALLSAGVAALVVAYLGGSVPVVVLVALASVALGLDAVDGWVARRTATATPLGGRMDGEVDAFLILVLSLDVSRDYGGWVLAIGIARYAFLAAGWVLRWLAAPLPSRYWRKVVAAVQGIVLTAAASGMLARTVGLVGVALALVLLTESFGRDVVWLYRVGAGARTKRLLGRATSVAAAAVVWAALVAPDRPDRISAAAFVRVPLELLGLVAIALWLPPRWRRAVAGVAGALFGVLSVVKILDLGFYQELGRPFNPVIDWGNLTPAVGVVRDSIGSARTGVLLVLVVVLLALLIAVITASTVRLTTVTARRRHGTLGGLAALGAVWGVSAALSLQLVPAGPVASTSAFGLAAAQVRDARAAVHDQHRFEAAIQARDPYSVIPASDLLTGLRGKDVIVVFVESYGRVAVLNSTIAPGVDAVLHDGTAALSQAGYSARSGFLTSPTYGGISWLAHSTLQSGLWVDNQQRYNQLTSSDRFTLSAAFGKAGWRTVSDIPSDQYPWPAGTSFYHYDKLYNRRDVGYRGPIFSYASMPDQYSLAAFQRLELYAGHRPVMAEIDLVSSHTPWTPLPSMVPWDRLGDGSIFDPMPAQGLSPAAAWRHAATVRRLYGQSIQYSLQALISWVARLHDPNLVLVMLGDHQPSATVSGLGSDRQVPISVVARDPAVLARLDAWRWEAGLLPSPSAPVWPMDAFRNRFLDAFNASSGAATAPLQSR